MTDRDFLIWLHERLEKIHGESPIVDYMHKLRSIIRSTPTDKETPNIGSCNSLKDMLGETKTATVSNLVVHVDLNRKDFIEKLKEPLGKSEHFKTATNAIGEYIVEAFIDSLDYDTQLLESLISLAIEKLEISGGVCLYDWHRTPFDPLKHNPDICSMCEKPKSEHELVPCCEANEV